MVPLVDGVEQLQHWLDCNVPWHFPSPPAVSVDVTRAFDCVDIPLLLSLVEPLLQHEAYIVLKYQEVGR